jgi:predicted MFS family arabinose efflux permease
MAADVRARPVPLWKNRDYVILWCGQTISIIGTQVSQLAFPLLVLTLTGSPAQAGFVAAARTVPWLLFALPAGALVDRWDRKRTMILSSAGSAVALASIAVAYPFGVLTIAQIVLVSFVEGTFSLVFGLAQTSALPHVVPKEQLPDAVAQQQAQYSVGSLIGPPLGGILYGIAHLLPFLVDAVSYAVSSCSLPFIRARFGGMGGAARRSLGREIGEGLGWLWRQPLIRFMAFLTGGFNVTAGTTLIVIVLAQRQGASPGAIGLMFAVAGVGGIVGAALAPRVQRRFTFGQAIIGLSWFFTLNTALLAGARSPALIALVLISFELIAPSYDTVQYSYRLAVIPDTLQGRVNSVFRLVAQGTRPLGLALTGILIERVGIVPTILIFSAWLVIVSLGATLNGHVRHAPALASAA